MRALARGLRKHLNSVRSKIVFEYGFIEKSQKNFTRTETEVSRSAQDMVYSLASIPPSLIRGVSRGELYLHKMRLARANARHHHGARVARGGRLACSPRRRELDPLEGDRVLRTELRPGARLGRVRGRVRVEP